MIINTYTLISRSINQTTITGVAIAPGYFYAVLIITSEGAPIHLPKVGIMARTEGNIGINITAITAEPAERTIPHRKPAPRVKAVLIYYAINRRGRFKIDIFEMG